METHPKQAWGSRRNPARCSPGHPAHPWAPHPGRWGLGGRGRSLKVAALGAAGSQGSSGTRGSTTGCCWRRLCLHPQTSSPPPSPSPSHPLHHPKRAPRDSDALRRPRWRRAGAGHPERGRTLPRAAPSSGSAKCEPGGLSCYYPERGGGTIAVAAGAVRPGDKGPGRLTGKRGSRSRAQSGPEGAAPPGTRGLQGRKRAWGGRNTQGWWDGAAGPGVFTLILPGEHEPRICAHGQGSLRDRAVLQERRGTSEGFVGSCQHVFFFFSPF